MTMDQVTVMDLFCGTGGFSKGFENSTTTNYKVIFGNDLLSSSIETFKLNHPNAQAYAGDIRNISCVELSRSLGIERGELGVIIGGPPCQGFSSLRPFRSSNLDDPRNSLFEDFVRFVNYFQPRFFVFENVVGLATHKNGNDILQIQKAFNDIGYATDWKLLNAANFGIPQRRERLILIGSRDDEPIIFPEPTHFTSDSTIGHKNKQRVLRPEFSLFVGSENLINLKPAVTVMEAIEDLPSLLSGESSTEYAMLPQNEYQTARRKGAHKLTMHSSTRHSEKMLEIIKHSGKNIYCIPKHLITSGFSSCYSRLDGDKSSVTITVNFVHPASNRCIHPIDNRALTPREGARLQSYDDDFLFAGSRSQIVKQIGEAVPPLLGQKIAESLVPIAKILNTSNSKPKATPAYL